MATRRVDSKDSLLHKCNDSVFKDDIINDQLLFDITGVEGTQE